MTERPTLTPPDPNAADDDSKEQRKRWSDRVIGERFRKTFERGVEAGAGTINRADNVIRSLLEQGIKPGEIVSYLFSTADETRSAVVRGVAREVRDFLATSDLGHEIFRALTSVSFEIRTEVRFIPNDKGGVRADVRTSARPAANDARSPKRESTRPRRGWGRRSEPPAADVENNPANAGDDSDLE